MVEPTGHCPYLGLKQNQAIRFASPTQEHRCYAAGQAQEIPTFEPNYQTTYCLSPNHTKCPLYTGSGLPSTPPPASARLEPALAPAGGLRGWFAGLAPRDRAIYGFLVGLLGLILLFYAVAGVGLLRDGNLFGSGPPAPGPAPTDSSGQVPAAAPSPSPSPEPPTPTDEPEPTATDEPEPTATRRATSTARPTARPTRTPAATPSTTSTAAPTLTPAPPTRVPPTQRPFIPPPPPPPTNTPSDLIPITAEPEPPTQEPSSTSAVEGPTTEQPPTPVVTPAEESTAEPPTAEPTAAPTTEVFLTRTPGIPPDPARTETP